MPIPIRRYWLCTTVALIAGGVTSVPRHSCLAQEETLESVIAAWQKREAATKSVKFEIAEDYLIGKGTISGGPPRDIETKQRVVIVLGGENMRHERVGDVWGRGRLEHMAWIAVIDGQRAKQLSTVTNAAGARHSTGSIEDRAKHKDVTSSHLAPFLWHFRPTSPKFQTFKPDALKIVSRKEMVDGNRSLLLEQPTDFPGRVWRIWVAPDREMSIVRAAIADRDVIRRQWDVTYTRDPKYGLLPTKWKTASHKNGATLSAGSITVTASDVNFPVPEKTFDIDFPPGTEVQDLVAKRR